MTSDDPLERQRVRDRIQGAILAFCTTMLGRPFHNDDLHAYVMATTLVAPDSPGRILRYLRQRGVVDYVVTDRRKSEYLVTRVGARRTVAAQAYAEAQAYDAAHAHRSPT